MGQSVSLKQRSMSGGIVSPQCIGHSDQKKYDTGLLNCSNAIITRFAAVQSRPGTAYLDTITPPGRTAIAWDGSAYGVGQVVSYAGNIYVALVDVPSTSTTPPASIIAVGTTVWNLITAYQFGRLIPFVFNNTTAYELVFLAGVIRVYRNGVHVAAPLSSFTAWSNATAYVVGNIVSSGGVAYVCRTPNTNQAPGSNVYWVQLQTNTAGNWLIDLPVNAYGLSDGQLVMPPQSLPVLQAVNNNDIMTVVSSYFQPFVLTRYNDSTWTVTPFVPGALLTPPASVVAVAGVNPSGGASPPSSVIATGGDGAFAKDVYVVCSAGAHFISGPSAIATATVGKADAANPVTLTWTNSGSAGITSYNVYKFISGTIYGYIGSTGGAAGPFVDAGITPNASVNPPAFPTGTTTFTYVVTAISAVDGSESLASAAGVCIGSTPTQTNPNIITWDTVAGASSYNIYSIVSGIPGLIGIAPAPIVTLNDNNIQPDFAIQPPTPIINTDGSVLFGPPISLSVTAYNAFFPTVVAYFQQRLCFSATANQPNTIWMSRVGSFLNFNVNTPEQDDMAVQFVVAENQAQPVIAMIDLQKLIIFTGNAEFAATGNQFSTITPSAVNCVLQGKAGAALPVPIIIGNTALFIQAQAQQVRDLRFQIQTYSYTGQDLTVFSTELFQGLTILDWAWQQIKDSIVWTVMSNGALYGLTYVTEHDIWAWHQHAFVNGLVENVCVVPNPSTQIVYLIVNRQIEGNSVYYLEQFQPRDYSDTVYYSDFWGVDCGNDYDGTVADGSSMTVTSPVTGNWTPSDLLTLTSSTARFSAADVTDNNTVVLSLISQSTGLVTDRVTFSILTYVSSTVVKGYAQRDVPTWAQATPITVASTTSWGKAVTQFANLTQLAGQSIAILGDGEVLASPLNPEYTPVVVSGTGTFSVPEAVLQVTAGLPFQMDTTGLPLENQQGPTIMNKHVQVKELCPNFFYSRGGFYGSNQTNLTEWQQPRTSSGLTPQPSPVWGQPIAPWSGPCRIQVISEPERTGQFWVRQVDPLPLSFSAMVVTAEIADS